MPAPVTHDTFVIERTYPQAPEKVFAAFADPARKQRWYAQGGAHDVVRYACDFRRGGHEVLIGKMKPGTPIAGAVLTWSQTYADIVADERIVFTQTLDVEDKRVSCALITVALRPAGSGCALVFTHQAAYFEGADGPQMRELGWAALLGTMSETVD